MKTDVKLPEEEKKEEKLVHVDFSKTSGEKKESPFQKAKLMSKRVKLFLWGPAGSSKTLTSIQFPKPVVIDLEGGTDLYGDVCDFDVVRTTSADETMNAVDWLLTNKHSYRTLVIDPITIYWDALQKKWSDIFLRRNKGTKGHRFEYYDMQVRDWQTIKSEFNLLLRKLLMLDMNVILTAREKIKYKEGSFMVAMGETFDGEKSLPYMFDTIIRLYVNEQGKYMGLCIKDRSNKLPKEEFECSYKVLEKYFGKEYLSREAKPIKYASQTQKEKIKIYIEQFKLTPEQVEKRLAAYDAETLDELTYENAEVIISKFESAIATKGNELKGKGGDANAKD